MVKRTIAEVEAQHGTQNTITITANADSDDWFAVAGPEIDGYKVDECPFEFVVVGNAPSIEVVAEMIVDKFEEKIDNVYKTLRDANSTTDFVENIEL